MHWYEWIGLLLFIATTLWLMHKAAVYARWSRSNRPPWYAVAWLLLGIVCMVIYASFGNK